MRYIHIYIHIYWLVYDWRQWTECPMIDLCRRRSNLVQNNIDIKTPVTNPVRTCAGSSRIQEWTGRAPRLIFMDCIFMDFEKRLLGGTSAWTKIEKTDRGGGEGVLDRRGLLNHYTVNCCFQLYSITSSTTTRSVSFNIHPISVLIKVSDSKLFQLSYICVSPHTRRWWVEI